MILILPSLLKIVPDVNIETVSAIALGIGLSASTGFRVFIPLLVAGLASHFGALPLGESFAWMGSTPALLCFGVASVAEILAYYIPFIDNLLDSVEMPLSIAAGTLLMTSVFPSASEWMKWILGFIIGGGVAITVQSGSAITRLMSSKITIGSGNHVFSTTEGIVAIVISVLAVVVPIFVAILVLVLIVVILRTVYYKLLKKKKRQTNREIEDME
jgi:uncharacterized membrane protein